MDVWKKSKLVKIGGILILIGLFLPRQIDNIAQSMDKGLLMVALFLFTDLFRLCFFVGVTCSIIGLLRNRKMKREHFLQEKVGR